MKVRLTGLALIAIATAALLVLYDAVTSRAGGGTTTIDYLLASAIFLGAGAGSAMLTVGSALFAPAKSPARGRRSNREGDVAR
jgi:hypothetical protein